MSVSKHIPLIWLSGILILSKIKQHHLVSKNYTVNPYMPHMAFFWIAVF